VHVTAIAAQVRLWNVAYLQEDGDDDAANGEDAPMEASDSDSDSDGAHRGGKRARGSGEKQSSKQLPQGGSASFFSDL
jgi:hypothetical protein